MKHRSDEGMIFFYIKPISLTNFPQYPVDMSSCPEKSSSSLNHPDHFRRSSPRGSGDHLSHSSPESSDGERDCRDTADFPFVIRIPTVVLRKHRKDGAYFVYMVCVTVRKTSPLGCVQRDANNEWIVGHRYTTLESLHADLMGQKLADLAADENGQNDGQPEYSEGGKLSGVTLAHSCLPRPLPGLEYFRFPRKRVLPTIPTLAAGRFPACLKNSSEWIAHHSAYVDYPVAVGESRRVEQRRRELEQYLNRLIRLVWCVSQTTEVDSVLRSVGVPRVPMRDGSGERTTGDPNRNEPVASPTKDKDVEQLKSRLIGLLPVLSENWQ
ncbi:hypothetical protein D915_008028 [Fasciola hepatica]|uniref:PX domain-containing protein n=1 Tax=Fasciola hepatica TaxID=6192 RepID=A0A4E0RK10_FASHE|nr:hypothetical protein D915_008028 [Fasciola hepatica]